jgi:hypothetical protein
MNENNNLSALNDHVRSDVYNVIRYQILAKWSISAARSKELAMMSYGEYLKTQEWSEIRKFMHDTIDHCAGCGSESDLQVHHSNYPKRGAERMADLTVLCGGCHAKVHGISPDENDEEVS